MIDWLNAQNSWAQAGFALLFVVSVIGGPLLLWGALKGLFRVFDVLMTEAHVSKSEFTTAGHASSILRYASVAFLVLGGAAGAIIGDIESWLNLPWIWATFITVGILALIVGVVAHVDDVK